MEFFRHCPECGRRFHIRLENRKMVHLERRTVRRFGQRGALRGYSMHPTGTTLPVVVLEGPPMTLDIEDFQYSYKCEHCGHEWTEHHTEEHKER